ncbi:hypothetical protein [Peribacillus sp. YIM B13482]|uniref:hypothetical protein n=1 Tax=Peribacillus sp. YIM B13482 TaxID=3366298 RepID=UPI00366D7B80
MNSLQINSFILTKKVTDIADLIKYPDDYTINLSLTPQPFVKIIKDNPSDYIQEGILVIDGGVILSFNNQTIVGHNYWDDLTTLWSYLLNVIDDYSTYGEGSCFYPDQPIEIHLKDVDSNLVVLSVDNKEIKINKNSFFAKIISEAKYFFEILTNDLMLPKYKHELKQIEDICKLLNLNRL